MGGNIGDVFSTFKEVLSRVNSNLGVVTKISKIYKSKPLPTNDHPPQDQYLNGVFVFESSLDPHDVLTKLIKIEESLGRDRSKSHHWGPRVIDLDIISVNDLVIDTVRLQVPHPRMCERDFVIIPLSEVSPEWVHPVTNQTIQDIEKNLPNQFRYIESFYSEL